MYIKNKIRYYHFVSVLLYQDGQDNVHQWLEEALHRSENTISSRLQYNYNIAKIDVSSNISFTSEARK